jgi:D-glycero-alpha-D-manno-heptose 1-phosphate guanylyltransferase
MARGTKVLLLVGGLGTRLRSMLPLAPKALARIGSVPFVELLISRLRDQGFTELIMCTGHLADQIERQFGDGSELGVSIEYSRESRPLGTGGAVKLAEKLLQDHLDFLVMNGDSLLDIDLADLVRLHRTGQCIATIAVVAVDDASRYGTIVTDSSSRILEFHEKTGDHSPGVINAGVYVFSSSVFRHIPLGEVSLEKGVFPKLLERGVYAAKQTGMFIDIGTPADYLRAQQLLDRLCGNRD